MQQYIGENIKSFRKKSGLSQQEIANYCNISRELISYYENGKRDINLLHLEKIAELLNINMEILLEKNPVTFKPDLAFTFRADELTQTDYQSIAYFKRIVKNYLKMKNIENTCNTD
ncbi:MAG: helix-turn-helix transcriptional regulator [Prolixibacteraceae bacterium]|nr:helix-turn-helix transcriptional regulator [Prolixibacteraceae bacterium]